jgi:iron complex transport system permease protein
VVAGVLLALAVAGVALLGLLTGDVPLSVPQVVAALAGRGDPGAAFVVVELRAPRVLTGLLVGVVCGVSGAVLQSVTRNPLGSPDFIGFTQGAATGALLALLVAHTGATGVALGALAGGTATAGLVHLLTRGRESGRLVLVGIGVSAALLAVNDLLVTRATWTDSLAAQVWLTGSLNERTWVHVVIVGAVAAVLLPVVVALARAMSLLELGDELAAGLGVRVQAASRALVAAAVLLAAGATAAAGPVAFLALTAPHLARSAVGSAGGVPLVAAAGTGALLVLAGDVTLHRLVGPQTLPVGVATGALGGLYLMVLLARSWRVEGRGGQ